MPVDTIISACLVLMVARFLIKVAAVKVALEGGDYAATAATFVPQQDIMEDIPVTDDDFLSLDDDEEAEEYDWYNEPPVEDFGGLDID